MCTNCRYIYNRYSRRHVLVKCGKCPACQQEKAMKRANRIRNNAVDGQIALFITLTYSNDFVPFIYRSDVYNATSNNYINVYRRCDIRKVFSRYDGKIRTKKDVGIRCIGSVPVYDIDITGLQSWHSLNGFGDSNAIGVCWYSDIQDFYKRLRITLQRNFNYEKSFSYFTCSELGSDSQRPHFHALLFIPRDDETLFRSAICEAWSYADKNRTHKYVEIARDAANYVASYVNGHNGVSSCGSFPAFKPKHSHSKGFGVVLDCFSLRSILQKIDQGDLCYYRRQMYDGQTDVSSLPIPLYVLYRYFPVCKGFNWLSSLQLSTILLDPSKVGDILTDFSFTARYRTNELNYNIPIVRHCKLINPVYHYTPTETYRIYVRLLNCQNRFIEQTGLSRYDYMFYYMRVFSVYKSMLLKMSHENIELLDNYSDFYENAYEVIDNPAIAPTLTIPLQIDPNKRADIVEKTDVYLRLFDRLDKQKKVTNTVMSRLGCAV